MLDVPYVMSNSRKTLSLQHKVSLTLLVVMTVLSLLSYGILNAVIAPAFDELELNAAQTNMIRVDRAIDAEIAGLSRIVLDWSPWDDTYLFVQGQMPAYEKSNLADTTMPDIALDLMLFYNRSGNLHWGRLIVKEEVRDLSSSGVFESGHPTEAQLKRHRESGDEIRGLLQTAYGPMLISSQPILRSDKSGPIAGTLVMGRFLNAQMLVQLRQRTEVDFGWQVIRDGSTAHQSEIEALLKSPSDTISHGTTAESVRTYYLRSDLNDQPMMLLHASTPRRISALGNQTLNGALLLLATATMVVALVIWVLLRNMIVKPLERVATHITSIRESGDLSGRIIMKRNDEIGTVADELDEMAGNLDDARKLLLDQSFKAGKADTAAEVMHNMRNAMTPLINGIDRLGGVFDVTKGLKVEQATQQLIASVCTSDRKEKLLQYIDSAFKHVENSHADGNREMRAISKQARLIEDILVEQEKHAHGSPVSESLELDDMLDEAVLVIPKCIVQTGKVPGLD